jgi:hypothetical protein
MTHLPNSLVRLQLNILDTSIDHQGKQVENQVRILPQPDESRIAERLESSIMG